MDLGGKDSLDAHLAAALDWWREAGVDSDWQDAPKSWLGLPEENPAAPPPPRPEASAPLPIAKAQPFEIPSDLALFRDWWLTEPRLDNGRVANRVPPRGSAGAEIMFVVAEPEREDTETLLSGPQGRLLLAMLEAMGISSEQAYFASVLPRHTPHADWKVAAHAGMGEVLARHIALATPKRLIIFGGTILPLLGHDPAQSPAVSLEFNREGAEMPMLATRDLAALLERPRWKAGFWRAWLDWTMQSTS
ncbi:MAG: uracil-DNA glycosylase family protein [Novosphingobium sp.]